MSKSIWDREEIEDIISRAFIGLYETKDLGRKKWGKRINKIFKNDIQFSRRLGCYFAPSDRVIIDGAIDIELDGLPTVASWSDTTYRQSSNNDVRDYITMYFAKKIDRLPGGYKTNGHYAYYQCISWYPQIEGGVHLNKEFFGIDKNGMIHFAEHGACARPFTMEEKYTSNLILAATLQFWQDKRNLWNVQATDGKLKGTFGIYDDQIKSLFYARDLPQTATGRKSPILHWVTAHKRRMKNGVDIDIKKHLRGTSEFIMDGTKFTVTNPTKKHNLKAA